MITVGQVSAKVVSLIWKYYSDVKNAKSDIRHLANEIKDFSKVLQDVHKFIENNPNKSKIPASSKLATTTKQSLRDIKELKKRLGPTKGAKAIKSLGVSLK